MHDSRIPFPRLSHSSRTLLVVCLAGLLACALRPMVTCAQIGDRSELAAALDSAARAHAADSMVAGTAVAIVQRGDTLLHEGYGQANLEFDVPMPRDAVFEVGSITKQFTAAAILQLAEKDSLDLGDDITEYLPEYSTRGHAVTLRNLLHHTSGIRSYTGLSQFQKFYKTQAHLPRDTVVSLIEDEPFRFAPGRAMSYSNSGYYLLGLIIEEVSEQSYTDYLEEQLLATAGMDASHYCDEQAVVKQGAQGYSWAGKEDLKRRNAWNHRWPYAAGSLCSTTGDLVRWNESLHGGGGEILSDSMHKELVTPGRLADGTKLRYGMGLAVHERGGQRVIEHGGAISGFLSMAHFYPEEDLTLVVLQNTRGPSTPMTLADSLARLVLQAEEPEANEYSGDLSELIGRYSGPARGGIQTIGVKEEDGELLFRGVNEEDWHDLEHMTGRTWRHKNERYQTYDHFKFLRGEDQANELHLDFAYGHYVLRRIGAFPDGQRPAERSTTESSNR